MPAHITGHPEHRPKSMETSLNRDCLYGLTLITETVRNRCHPHTVTHHRSQQMPPSHSPEASTDATLTLTRGLNRCYTHTHQRSQQKPPSYSPEASTDATLTLPRGLNRCYTHTHQRPQQMLPSHSQETIFTGGFLQQRPPSMETALEGAKTILIRDHAPRC